MNSYVLRLLVPLFIALGVGIFCLPWHPQDVALSLLGWFLFGCIGVEIGLHRYFSHSMFRLSRSLRTVVTVLGIYGAQHSPIKWRALHVKHHADADTRGDVHSPAHGFWHALLGWYLCDHRSSVSLRASRALIRDPFQRFVHNHYYVLFWTPPLMLGLVDYELAYFFFILPAFLCFMQTNLVNSLCHVPQLGYRNYAVSDNSRNVTLVGYLSWGLGFHNNHHAQPRRWDFGRNWWELDPCRFVIPLLIRASSGHAGDERG